jgi:hypothetical protein
MKQKQLSICTAGQAFRCSPEVYGTGLKSQALRKGYRERLFRNKSINFECPFLWIALELPNRALHIISSQSKENFRGDPFVSMAA